MGGFAWVTLATNDSYSLGALVLAHSLRKVATAHQLAVLITPAVSPAMRDQLGSVYDVVKVVDVLDSKDEANLALLKRPELGITFTKLHCWQLTQFEKGVFLDADTLVVRNCDELFEREEFSAAPDVGWPDCFNSGVFVFRPSNETFNSLVQFAVEKGSFDGGDQGLLNQFFSTWATDDIKKHLPFVYNLTSVAVYSYKPAFKQYGADTRIVHFIGPVKPWLQPVDPSSRTVTPTADSEHLQPLLQQWWDLFIEKVHPGLSASLDCDNGLLRFFALPTCTSDPLDSTPARSDPPPPPVEPSFPEPYTPYIEKDDERQYNLPYQPFQVVSLEGELLNITFSDFARDNDLKETQLTECVHVDPEHVVTEFVEPVAVEEIKEDYSEEEPRLEEPQLPPPTSDDYYVEKNQFDYHRFVPDENCIQAYLEHNIQEYQAVEHHNWWVEQPAPAPPPEESHWEPPSLPRFLTIPQDDQRQSNTAYVRDASPERHWSHEEQQQWVPWEMPAEQHIEPTYEPAPPRAPSPAPLSSQPDHAVTRSKSMSNLIIDATDSSTFGNLTAWKSQPDVSIESPKKLPGLKPLLPKDKIPITLSSKPKYTESTEVHMINTSTDPLAPPIDTVGFVERAIMKRAQSQKALFDIPQGALESDVPTVKPIPVPNIFVSQEINEYVDLSECKRQAGNKPLPQELKPAKEEKLLRRKVKGKRPSRKAVDKWKPPETEEATYDVDLVMKRLSALSSGYSPPKPLDDQAVVHDFSKYRDYVAGRAEVSSRGLAAFDDIVSNGNVESAADRLFRDSSENVEEKSKENVSRNVMSHSARFIPVTTTMRTKRKARKNKAETILKPFAAAPGESLSEMDGSVPEIIVCVATPQDEDVGIHNKTSTPLKTLDHTYVVKGQENGTSVSPPADASPALPELICSEASLLESSKNFSDCLTDYGSAVTDESFVSAKSCLSPENGRRSERAISDKSSATPLELTTIPLSSSEGITQITHSLSKLDINDKLSNSSDVKIDSNELNLDAFESKEEKITENELIIEGVQKMSVNESGSVHNNADPEVLKNVSITEKTRIESGDATLIDTANTLKSSLVPVESDIMPTDDEKIEVDLNNQLELTDEEKDAEIARLILKLKEKASNGDQPDSKAEEETLTSNLDTNNIQLPTTESSADVLSETVANGIDKSHNLEPYEPIQVSSENLSNETVQKDILVSENSEKVISMPSDGPLNEKVVEIPVGPYEAVEEVLLAPEIVNKIPVPSEGPLIETVGQEVSHASEVVGEIPVSSESPLSETVGEEVSHAPETVNEVPVPSEGPLSETIGQEVSHAPETVGEIPVLSECPLSEAIVEEFSLAPEGDEQITVPSEAPYSEPVVDEVPVAHEKVSSDSSHSGTVVDEFSPAHEEVKEIVSNSKESEILSNIEDLPINMASEILANDIIRTVALENSLADVQNITIESGRTLPQESVGDDVEISEDCLKFDFSKLVSDDDRFSKLETSTPSKTLNNQPVYPVPEKVVAGPSLTYAAAAKKESSGGATQVPIQPSPSTSLFSKPPAQQNGVKSKKPVRRKVTPIPTTSRQPITISQPSKIVKRKAEKMDVEYPVNRFELLPEEIEEDELNHKKRYKKVNKRFAIPSTSNSSPPPLTETIVEEDTQLYLGEPDDNPGIAGAIAQLTLDASKSGSPTDCSAAQAEYLRRQSWETGKMDYMGRDSFANVWSKISQTLSQQTLPEYISLDSDLPLADYRPVSLSMILDCESIETLPADIMTLPGEVADDDVIFSRHRDSTVGLPGIKEEVEDPEEACVGAKATTAELNSDNACITILTTPATPLDETIADDKQNEPNFPATDENVEEPAILEDAVGLKSDEIVLENRVVKDERAITSEEDQKKTETFPESSAIEMSVTLQSLPSSEPVSSFSKESAEVKEKVDHTKSPISSSAIESVNAEIAESSIAEKLLTKVDKVETNTSVSLEPSQTDTELVEAASMGANESIGRETLKIGDVINNTEIQDKRESEPASAFAAYKPVPLKDKNIVEPVPIRRQSSCEEGKEKKGMFTKILEFVGVVKKKDETETPTSVFYDDAFESKLEEVPAVGVEGIQNILKATDLGAIGDDSVEERKKRSPSPRVNIPKVPHTHVIAATPPTSPAHKPPRRDPEALAVDLTILETPPVVEKKTSILLEPDLDVESIESEIDSIIEKAKLIAEDQLDLNQPVYSIVLKEVTKVSESPKPPLALCEDFEDLKVTSDDERRRLKDNSTPSKLAGQILKAIPPPRRRPISDARLSSGSRDSEERDVSDVVSSSISNPPPPVPPRRNRSRQRNEPQAPPKRKPKK